ncbi:MAG: Hsp70 family protein [Kofleriaceae bacterium]
MSLALGIDLGTTNSVAAVATPTGVEFILGGRGERVHPSVVAYPATGGIVVGADAKAHRLNGPERVVSSAKRLIGQNFRAPIVQLALTGLPYKVEEGANQQPVVVVGGRRVTVPEVSAQVLGHLRRCAERQLATPVTQAVVTVPANFTDAQRQATKEAGRLAGLEVLRLINEPTAAALAYGFGKRLDETLCVFDFGGGTFDVSLLQIKHEVFEVIASDGDFFLGGDDLDRSVAEFLAAEMNRTLGVDPRGNPGLMMRLTLAAEAVKVHLSEFAVAEGEIDDLDAGDGRVFKLPFRLARRQFESMINGYVGRTIELCRNVLASAGLQPSQITDVLCVGGSTRIPLVRQRLAELFGKAPAIQINPDEVVAHGAAIQAGSLTGQLIEGTGMAARDAVPTAATSPLDPVVAAGGAAVATGPLVRPLLLDVAPASLGLQTVGGYVEVVLAKNAPIPIERTRGFSTANDDQTRVAIDCCRGESRRYADNEPLGSLELLDLAPRPRGEVTIDVTFRIDPDGILHVRAADAATGVAQATRLSLLGAPTEDERRRPGDRGEP